MTISENVVSLQRCLMINKTTKQQIKIVTTKNKKKWKTELEQSVKSKELRIEIHLISAILPITLHLRPKQVKQLKDIPHQMQLVRMAAQTQSLANLPA